MRVSLDIKNNCAKTELYETLIFANQNLTIVEQKRSFSFSIII